MSPTAKEKEKRRRRRKEKKQQQQQQQTKKKEGAAHELRTKLMAQLNEAYGKKDILKMKSILEEWYESPESVAGDDITAELERTHRVIVRIKRGTLNIEPEIAKIKASDMYLIMVKADEAERAGRDILAKMTVEIDAKIETARSTLFMRMYA